MTSTTLPLFKESYRNKTVLVTGHTGFKGSWLALWLRELGATVIGFSLEEGPADNLFHKARLQEKLVHLQGDIRNLSQMKAVFEKYRPDFVFHLAAQAIVRESYISPVETFSTNVQGTVNVLECLRTVPFLKAAILITSDKCYKNKEWVWGYREHDELGGHDPYSASKACAEMAIASYTHSFFPQGKIASARAGNVIGGGDWGKDRIIPDCIRALLMGKPIGVRNPMATRPWQHVLEPLSGYLLLAACLAEQPQFAGSWNFGPDAVGSIPVQLMVEKIIQEWGNGSWVDESSSPALHEPNLLNLDSSKARFQLGWIPRLDLSQAVQMTVEWYKKYPYADVYELCRQQISLYESLGETHDRRN